MYEQRLPSACVYGENHVSPVRPLLQDVGNLCFFAEVAAFAAYAGRSAGGAPLAGRADGLVRAQRACHAREPGSDSDHRRCRGGGLGRDLLVFPARARLTFEDAFVRVLGLNTLVYFVFGVGARAAALFATLGVLGHAPLALTVPWLVVVPFCLLAARFVGPPAILRFYVLHCVGFPLIAAFLIAVHFWRVRKDGGISGPL